MKKLLATLLASTMALTAIGGLVACGDDGETPAGGGGYNDPFAGTITGTWDVPTDDSYYVAGGLKGYPQANWNDTVAPEGMKLLQNSDNENLYKIELNLYDGDTFKLRFEGLDWDDAPGISSINAQNNLLESLKTGDIQPVGDGFSSYNFGVKRDGKYELRFNAGATPDSIVTYVRLGDAPVIDGSDYVWYITGGAANMWNWAGDMMTEAQAELGENADMIFAKDATTKVNTLTITLAANDEFKFVVAGKGWSVQLDSSKMATLAPDFEDAGGNFKCVNAGTYTFTINKEGTAVTYTKAAE